MNAKPMTVGQHEIMHIKLYAQDNAQTPSQVVDTTAAAIVTSSFTTIVTVSPVAGDSRAFDIHAVGPGIGTITITESPPLPTPQVVNVVVTAASQPDNRRADVIGFDDPV